ncbi:hypothetical protein Tco_0168194, partial [Tanacetum coccineum]
MIEGNIDLRLGGNVCHEALDLGSTRLVLLLMIISAAYIHLKFIKASFGFIEDVITKKIDYHLFEVEVEFHRAVREMITSQLQGKLWLYDEVPLVDKKKVIITETSIRSNLHLEDAGGTDFLPTATIFDELARIRRKQRKETEVPQDETHHDDSVPIPFNDPLLSGEDRLQLTELMILCTNLQKQVESSKDKESLGTQEDASKEGRINFFDETQGRLDDVEMFDTDDLHGDEVIVDMAVGEKQEQSAKIYSMEGEDEFHDDNPLPPPPPVTPTQQAPHTLSTIKLLILKKGEYDIWAMKMEHYLRNIDYPIWEIIQKGNGPVQVSIDINRQIKVLPPKTAKEILARERERKARTTLLIAIPEDHLAKFYKMTDAKGMWEAIKSRFGGNDESKKMKKYILKQQFESFYVSNSEGLHKGYNRSLPASWSQVSLIMRTKPGVDTLSFDDLYNNLRVFEYDIKGSTTSSSSIQNVAFVSSESTNSTNDVSTAYGVSTSFG